MFYTECTRSEKTLNEWLAINIGQTIDLCKVKVLNRLSNGKLPLLTDSCFHLFSCPGAVIMKDLSQILASSWLYLYGKVKPKTWLRSFMNTTQACGMPEILRVPKHDLAHPLTWYKLENLVFIDSCLSSVALVHFCIHIR